MKRGVNVALAIVAAFVAAAAWRVFWGLLAAPWVLAVMVAGSAPQSDVGTLWLAWKLRREWDDTVILEAATMEQVLALDVLGWLLTVGMAWGAWAAVRRRGRGLFAAKTLRRDN